jgi:hypothetical protein
VILICLITGYSSTGANIVDRVRKINLSKAFGKRRIVKIKYAFLANESVTSPESLSRSLVSFYFWFSRVSLAEYLLVLRALFPLVADGQMYYGYCINCLYPAMGKA